MTLVRDEDTRGAPAMHALVVGVGQYPWLLGGASPRGPETTAGMGQLDSPPISARMFADWLITEFDHPDCGLATVDLLLSDPATRSYVDPQDGREHEIEVASRNAIRAAASRWQGRGRASEDDMLVFFFCGHGVVAGYDFALLASDFGEDEDRPWDGAFNVPGFVENMRSTVATRQLYFIDACRVASDALRRLYTDVPDPLVGSRLPLNGRARQSVFYSTLAGGAAFGRNGAESLFTSALLKALRGLGASDNHGYWSVETTVLQRALSVLSDALADSDEGQVQTPQTGTQSAFEVTRLAQAPVVPLLMQVRWHQGDDPPDELLSIQVASATPDALHWPSPWAVQPPFAWQPDKFRCDLRAGMSYSCTVEFANGTSFVSSTQVLSPPYRLVEIPEDGIA